MAEAEERPSGGEDEADMAEAEESPSGGGDDEKGKYPLGFRFQPMIQELVGFYLLPKLLDRPTVPNDVVIEADAYECDPEILTKRYEDRGADESWYFLSPRSRRYPGGDRPTRRTADNRGRWKPSTGQSKPPGKDAAAGHSKAKKGFRKDLRVGAFEFTENTLAYYVGEPRNETKTKWLMLELTVPDHPEKEGPTAEKPRRDHMLLNKYVVCKIYKSPLKKWKQVEKEEGSTSAAPACHEEVPTSSQSGPAPESSGSGEASAPTPLSSKCAGKRPAPEQPTSEQANAPNKRASQHAMPLGTPVPTTHANGGGMRAPPAGVGAPAGYYDYRGVPVQLPPLMHWPPAIYSSMQGAVQMQRRPPPMYAHNGQSPVQGPPVQMQRCPPSMYAQNGQPPVQGPSVQMQRPPPSMYAHNGQPPVQGPPVLKLYPPHGASATAPNSLGQTVTMRPPNQLVRPPSSFPRPPPPQQQQQMEAIMRYQQRVYAQLIADMKLHKRLEESASCAGQQQQMKITSTASTQPPCLNEGANHHPSGTKFMVPHHTQFPAHHHNSNFYPCSGVQQQQQQQSCPAIPAASVLPGAAAPVEVTTPAADEAPGNKLPMQGGTNEGTGDGDCYDYCNKQPVADFAADLADMNK